MAGQPPQDPEDDFLDQFFSLTNSLFAAGRPSGDQPFSLALSLDVASGSKGGIRDDAGNAAERNNVQLPGLFPPVFGSGLQPPPLRPNHPPPQMFHTQQPNQGGPAGGLQPPAPRPKVRARRGQATDPHSIAERAGSQAAGSTVVMNAGPGERGGPWRRRCSAPSHPAPACYYRMPWKAE